MTPTADKSLDMVEQALELALNLSGRLELLTGGSGIRHEISMPQYRMLSVVAKHGTVSIGNIAELVGSAQSTTSEMISRLMKTGLVEKVRGTIDGRVVMVGLTAEGRKKVNNSHKKIRTAYQMLFAKFSEEERAGYMASMKILNDVLREKATTRLP